MTEYSKEQLRKFETLVEIVDRLRSPGGCPWDIEQTRDSLRPYVLEEAYEVVEAIDSGSDTELCEELGDLFLQIVLHSRIGKEEKTFTIGDVIEGISSKLVRRHPHVFGDVDAKDPDTVLRNWNQIKASEKKDKAEKSILSGVPKVLPAQLKAVTYTKRAAQVGFDWDNTTDVIAKLREEVDELEESLKDGSSKEIEAEMGDILFVMANLARRLKVNPEMALEASNIKFKKRFQYIEKALAAKGSSPQESDLEEMDALWNEAKLQLKEVDLRETKK